MNKADLVKHVREQCALLGEPLTDWTDDEVLNLAKTWGLTPKD